jgi:UDP-2,4-diacetamido-2,4,6-trideoxy-beta-L-altropyranose hydrolase
VSLTLPSTVIRCDGSATLGTGHVHRCLVLAAELAQRGRRIGFVSRDLPAAPLERIRRAGHALHFLPAELSEELDCTATAHFARALAADWLVLDRYATGARELELMTQGECKLLAIDDVCEHPFPVEMLLNQNVSAAELPYVTRADTVRLLGSRFALVAGDYTRARSVEPAIHRPCRRILVFMGGGDVLASISSILQSLARLRDVEPEVRVIVGTPFYAQAVALARLELPRARVEHGYADLVEPLRWADLFVTAGGSVVWEACCLGVSMLVLPVASNQELNASHLQRLGAAAYPGNAAALSTEQLVAALSELVTDPQRLLSLRRSAWRLVDGLGVQRVADAMQRTEHSEWSCDCVGFVVKTST